MKTYCLKVWKCHTGPLQKQYHKSSSWFSCYLNLCGTIIGAGIISIPYAFSKVGWILGLLLLIICASISMLSLHFLAVSAMPLIEKKIQFLSHQDKNKTNNCINRDDYNPIVTNASNNMGIRESSHDAHATTHQSVLNHPQHIIPTISFYELSKMIYPSLVWSILLDIIVSMLCTSIATAYLILIGDSMPLVLSQLSNNHLPPFILTRQFSIMLSFMILGPLSSFPQLDTLKYTSCVAGFLIVFLVGLVILYSIGLNDYNPHTGNSTSNSTTSTVLFEFNISSFRSVPLFLFSFCCQTSLPTIMNELSNPSLARVNSVSFCAIFTAFTLYMIIAACGYSTFGSSLVPDILTLYPKVPIVTCCRLMLVFISICHYPLQLLPARTSLLSVLTGIKISETKHDTTEVELSSSILSSNNVMHGISTFFLLIITLSISLSTDSLGSAYAIIGSTGGIILIFFIPSLYYMKVMNNIPTYFILKANSINTNNITSINLEMKNITNLESYDPSNEVTSGRHATVSHSDIYLNEYPRGRADRVDHS
eukprot:gene6069-8356_t